MAASGQVLTQITTVEGAPDSLMQGLVAATAGANGYTLNTAGPNSLVLTRSYRPTWVWVVIGIGGFLGLIGLLISWPIIFLFLLSLLALIAKSTESLSITLTAVAGNETRVNVTGNATEEMTARIVAALSPANAKGSAVEAEPAIEQEVASEDEDDSHAGTKVCPDCAETVKAQARKCRFCGYVFATGVPA